MCGICGLTLDDPRAGASEAAAGEVRRMVARLAHRGPGERAVLAAGGGVLGAARLHVTDPLAASGPYTAADGRVVATVNGEIWNHAALRDELRARGIDVPPGPDTAVVAPLVAADGVAALARLRGMFALALHDARSGETVLARDRFGIKPLYVADGPPLAFASEPSALPASGRLDRDALRDYLALGVVPAPRTLDAAVRKVPAGTALVVGPRGRTTLRFAPPPAPATATDAPAPAEDAVRDALAAAVARHLMGDVPVGVYLSGGVDSAAVAALVRAAGAPLRTFALGFPGEGRYDESAAARRSAELLGAEHTEVAFAPDDLAELLAACARAFGEPFGDSSALAVLALSRAAARDVTVVLTGTGADELFLGYRRYRLGDVPRVAAPCARALAAVLPTSRRGAGGSAAAWARKLAASARERDPAARYLERLAVVPAAWRVRLLGDADPPPVLERLRAHFRAAPTFADAARAADLDVYLPDDLLAKEDRTTMACGLENRVPFLDDAVADLAGAAPARAHGADKRLLRRALRGVLPRELTTRRKHGFAVPVSEWLRGRARDVVRTHLLDRAARVRDVLDAASLDALAAAHAAGDDALGPAVYALVALEAALRERA